MVGRSLLARGRIAALLLAVAILAGCEDESRPTGEWSSSRARTDPLVIPMRRIPLLDIADRDWARVAARIAPAIRQPRHGSVLTLAAQVADANALASPAEERVRAEDGAAIGATDRAAAGTAGSDAIEWMTTPSLCVHALRLHGRDARFADCAFSESAEVIAALTDSDRAQQAFGGQLFARTRFGIRFRPLAVMLESRTRADESHLDQTLAALLELGVPLRQDLRLGSERFTLLDVLDDAVASFYPHSAEIEWTAVALVCALPPARSWRNRYGEVNTFDALAERLIRREFGGAACGGTHILYAMVLLARAQEQESILSEAVERQLLERLGALRTAVMRSQLDDGSWGLDWHRGAAAREGAAGPGHSDARVLATGHLGECMLRMPAALQLGDDSYRRAGVWLWRHLAEGVANDAVLREGFCPLTHAACVVQALRRADPGQRDGALPQTQDGEAR